MKYKILLLVSTQSLFFGPDLLSSELPATGLPATALQSASEVMATGVAPATAQGFTFPAISFTDRDSGEVPYYFDNRRQALAINAAIEAYRSGIARASITFDGPTATYDLTLTTLGELDGECDYRILVDGRTVAEMKNLSVDVDYTPILHTFRGIPITRGSLVSVEANVVSNGFIPEGDAYAFARGRWTALNFSPAESLNETPPPSLNKPVTRKIALQEINPFLPEGVTIDREPHKVGDLQGNFMRDLYFFEIQERLTLQVSVCNPSGSEAAVFCSAVLKDAKGNTLGRSKTTELTLHAGACNRFLDLYFHHNSTQELLRLEDIKYPIHLKITYAESPLTVIEGK